LKKIIICFLVFMFFSGSCNAALEIDNRAQTYLEQNKEKMDLEKEEIELLKPFLEDNSIFLAGSTPGLARNSEVKMTLLKTLHQNAGVTYLLEEVTYAMGEFLNLYLDTGEEEYLDTVITYWRRDQQTKEFYEELREYNKELKEEGKQAIEIIGIDVQGPPRTLISIAYLAELISPRPVPKELEEYLLPLFELRNEFSSLRGDPEHQRFAQTSYQAGISTDFLKDVEEFAQNLKTAWEEDPDKFDRFLDENSEEILFVVNNILDAFELEKRSEMGVEKSYSFRNKIAFQNFLILSEDLPEGKFFGQWGELHIFQDSFRNVNWLGKNLNTPPSPYAGQVLSIFLAYYESMQMPPYSPGESQEFDSSFLLKDLEKLADIAENELTLFSLVHSGSPFTDNLYFLDEQTASGVTTNFFQFLLLIKESPPVEPIFIP